MLLIICSFYVILEEKVKTRSQSNAAFKQKQQRKED